VNCVTLLNKFFRLINPTPKPMALRTAVTDLSRLINDFWSALLLPGGRQ